MPAETVVLLPGTASDENFVRFVFAEPLSQVGAVLTAPRVRTVADRVEALDNAWTGHPIVVGGVSLGAHVAARWAAGNPDKCAGLVLALPAWTGPAGDAPAALAARVSARVVADQGLETALAGTTGWLRDELSRAWRGYGDQLVPHLEEASASEAPTLDELRSLRVPTGIVGCTDDPVHPIEVAREWADALPRAVLTTTTLDAYPHALGRAVQAWRRARD
ncbi:Alpha/beta hydrolase family protein [Lentzea fradiae]|uniref:Alpha/beta hydrolase family protein n=1 Tax=Lentzea fradiae TaxID=200378 RepID=A0A1G7ZZV2_9PSEU|nr:alpha/beta hydrolase [Lentzea fradiae]SDH14198.1 Alpha/beta hydrolase family protein [Lentzea fradiae]